MPKKVATCITWLVLMLALLGQTVSASYGVSQICDALANESLQLSESDSPTHDMQATDMAGCCEESSNGTVVNCEMHSCVFVGLQANEFKLDVAFDASRYDFDLQYPSVLVTLDILYRPPILI